MGGWPCCMSVCDMYYCIEGGLIPHSNYGMTIFGEYFGCILIWDIFWATHDPILPIVNVIETHMRGCWPMWHVLFMQNVGHWSSGHLPVSRVSSGEKLQVIHLPHALVSIHWSLYALVICTCHMHDMLTSGQLTAYTMYCLMPIISLFMVRVSHHKQSS